MNVNEKQVLRIIENLAPAPLHVPFPVTEDVVNLSLKQDSGICVRKNGAATVKLTAV